MQNELDIVRDVSERLGSAGIGYMLTGSMAMNYYAQPRMTRDIDVVVELRAGQVDEIVQLFARDYYVVRESVAKAVADQSMFNVIHEESVIKVDFIVRKDDAYRRTEIARRQRVEIEGFATWITSKEDLILSKLVWAKDSRSEMQLGDVRNLIETGFDLAYVEEWAGRLGVAQLLTEVRE